MSPASRGRPRFPTATLRAAAWAGACLGLAILIRSTAVLLPFLLLLWLLLHRPMRESWRAAAVQCTVSCLVVAPWLVRNELALHSFAISTNGGYTLWSGTKEGQPSCCTTPAPGSGSSRGSSPG